MIFVPVIAAFILIIAYFLYLHYSQQLKRKLALRKWNSERDNLHNYHLENSKIFKNIENKEKLIDTMIIFISEKSWCESFSNKDKFQEAIHACLPIFNRKTNYYPGIKKISNSRSFKQWLDINEKQFELEFGKMALKTMNGNFSNYSILFFTDHQELKDKHPSINKQLTAFYNN